MNHIHKILEELANWYAKLINQYKFKHQLTFSEFFNKNRGGKEIISETEIPITFSITEK